MHERLSETGSSPAKSAAEMGFRMPAEWEPMDAVWVTPPHNEETWPGCFEDAQRQHAAFVEALKPYVRVETPQANGMPTNDSWIRDYGPIFVVDGKGGLACHDFHFNGWGGKYGAEYDSDDVVPQRVAHQMGIPVWVHDMTLEGGSIEVNGQGTVLTTGQCLLNDNRNPDLTREQIEAELHAALGTSHAIFLPGGIIGDDTDGHIDDIARFISPDTVLAIRAPEGHEDAAMLEQNWQALQDARDQAGQKLNVIALPVPDPIIYNFPPDRFGPGGEGPVPASYANFLIANDAVLVPVFGQQCDDEALRIFDNAMPKHTVVPVRAERLVVGLGALHCLSQQQPRV